jgi:hypothetical protein
MLRKHEVCELHSEENKHKKTREMLKITLKICSRKTGFVTGPGARRHSCCSRRRVLIVWQVCSGTEITYI